MSNSTWLDAFMTPPAPSPAKPLRCDHCGAPISAIRRSCRYCSTEYALPVERIMWTGSTHPRVEPGQW
jgi:hypothetical protein